MLAAAGAARAGPRVTSFECQIGSGRGIYPVRADELESDDELDCRAAVTELGGRGPADLVAELRLIPRRGPVRTVASVALEAATPGRARTPEMYVSHSTWASAIEWRRLRGPRLELLLCILERPAPGTRTWRIVSTLKLVLGERPR